MAWNSLTNQRAMETTTRLVVAICEQMEGWRRLLRHIDRIDHDRQPAPTPPAAVGAGAARLEPSGLFHSPSE